MGKRNSPGCGPGCCGATNCGQVCVTVRGCAAALLPGAVVSLTLGGVAAGSCTTNGSGVCCISVTSTGTFAVNVTAPVGSNYANKSTTVNIAACDGTTRNVTVTLDPATGYSCTRHACWPATCWPGSPPYANATVPTTLYLDDGFGLVTLALDTGYPGVGWFGTATRTAASGSIPDPADPDGFTCTGETNLSVPVSYAVICLGGNTGQFSIGIGFKGCKPPNFACVTGTTGTSTDPDCVSSTSASASPFTTECPPDIALSATISNPSGSSPWQVYGASLSVTVSS